MNKEIENNQVAEKEPSYQVIKNIIKGKLNSVAESFVSIGYQLKKVRNGELYKEDGYSDIYEFALQEYNLTKSNVSRFMSINDRFSENGDSPYLIKEYAGYGSSKLSEMLTLDDEELKLISEKATVKEIREVKQMKSEGVQNEVVATSQQNSETVEFTQSNQEFKKVKNEDWSTLKSFVLEYFTEPDKRGQLKELRELTLKAINESDIAVIVNPSGHSTFRKGMLMSFLEEKAIKIKKFGSITLEFSYTDFLDAAEEIFNFKSVDPWADYFGEPEKETKEPKEEPEEESEDEEPEDKPEPQKTEPKKPEPKKEVKNQEPPKTSISPKQEIKEDNSIPGQKNINEYPEYLPETKEIEKVKGEVVEDSIEETSQTHQIEQASINIPEDDTVIHDLKTDSLYFADILSGIKNFELRLNDRNFKVGDILRLNENINGNPTGRSEEREITYILQGYQGLLENYCILGLEE